MVLSECVVQERAPQNPWDISWRLSVAQFQQQCYCSAVWRRGTHGLDIGKWISNGKALCLVFCLLLNCWCFVFMVNLNTTCSHRRREHTQESLGHIVLWASLWEIVLITFIQVGRPPIVGGTIPLVSVLDCVNVERGLHTNGHTWIHSLSALDCGHDMTKCFKFLPQPPKIMDCDPKRWQKKPFSSKLLLNTILWHNDRSKTKTGLKQNRLLLVDLFFIFNLCYCCRTVCDLCQLDLFPKYYMF